MAIDTAEVKGLLKVFSDEIFTHILKVQKETEMEDEYFATVVSAGVTKSVDASIKMIEVYKQNEYIDKKNEYIDKQKATETNKALDVLSMTTVRNAQSSQDILNKKAQVTLMGKQGITEDKKVLNLTSRTAIQEDMAARDKLIKDQQEIGERIKNGGVSYSYTYNTDGTVATKTLDAGGGKSIYEYQSSRMYADMLFINEQKTQLGYSVTYNNRLKTLNNYSDVLGNLGIGGFTIPVNMWTTYFGMVNDIYTNYGSAPAAKSFTTTLTTELVKAANPA